MEGIDLSSLPPATGKFLYAMSKCATPDSFIKGLAFKPEPTDVILSCPAKVGSTWLKHIMHGLRSRGDMSFEEISAVIPILEVAHDAGYGDLQKPQGFTPRMFKTHRPCSQTPTGAAKYIVLTRNPADAALSLYNYQANWVFSPDDISVEEGIKWGFFSMGEPKNEMEFASHFHHLVSWYPRRNDDNVLFLCYEDMKANLPECVRLIAKFLEIGADDEELLELVTKQASFEFMKQHDSKFDDHLYKLARNEAMGLAKEAGMHGASSKVRTGKANEAKAVLPRSVLDEIEKRWKSVVTAATGYETYADFRNGLNREFGRSFK